MRSRVFGGFWYCTAAGEYPFLFIERVEKGSVHPPSSHHVLQLCTMWERLPEIEATVLANEVSLGPS